MASFNLVDEPWIPCLTQGGECRELGLRDALVGAPDLREVVDSSPLVTVALHRLLLAVLHRVFGPRDQEAWAALWRAERFDPAGLDEYLDAWRGRFDLFDEARPFYQVASLDYQYAVPIANLAHELASSANRASLFDHTIPASSEASPAQAARYLIAYQLFGVGGMISLGRDENPALAKSTDAGPLTKTALVLAKGSNLFQTLMLNLLRYDPPNAEPFQSEPDDRPAWERDEQTSYTDRYPLGYLDLLTWQSRRVRLKPEPVEDGRIVIRQVVRMKGHPFPSGWQRLGHETMLAFKRQLKAQPGHEPWPPVAFREDRALWRDSHVLFQSVGDRHERPRNLGWIGELTSANILDRSRTVQLDLLGMTTDQAKVLLWRHERLPLPVAYLTDLELYQALVSAIELAEAASRELERAVWTLAKLSLAPRSDELGASQPKTEQIRALVRSLAPGAAYWPRLEAPFRHLLVDLEEDVSVDGDGCRYHGMRTLPEWARTLRLVSLSAFGSAVDGYDSSPRTIRAVARAENEFRRGLTLVFRKASHNWPSSDEESAEEQEEAAPTQHERRFADYLKRLADDENRAALAALRRGLGKRPGEVSDPSPYVDPWLTPDASRRDEEAHYLVASLFGLHPVSLSPTAGNYSPRNLGASLERLLTEGNRGAVQRRSIAALNSHREELGDHLRHLVGLLGARRAPVDWAQLLHDVERWDNPHRCVQREWARAFWRELQSSAAADSSQVSGDAAEAEESS